MFTYRHLEVVAPAGAARFRHLEGYDDDFMLLEGEELVDEYPSDASYRMNPNFPDDIGLEDAVYNLDYQLVVSERLRDFLMSRLGDRVELLPVDLVNHKGRSASESYVVVNILDHQDAINKEATLHEWNELDESLMIGVKNLTVDPGEIDPESQLFRLQHLTDVIGVRSDLADALEAEGFTGLSFADFANYRG